MDEYFMDVAIKQALKAKQKNEVPVGAVIVKNNKIISKGYNKKEIKNDVTMHAEIIAIKKACKKIKNWRLEDCILYVTLEPCMMCCGAIQQARIKKIVYGVKNDNYGCSKYLNNIQIISQVCEKKCKMIIQSFFQKKR